MPEHPTTPAPPPPPLTGLPLFDDTPPPTLPHQPPLPAATRSLAGPTTAPRRLPSPTAHRPHHPAPAPPPETPVPALSGPVDWGLVRAFRQQAADQLAAATREREGLDEAARHELGRRIVLDLLSAHADQALTAGADTFTHAEQQVLAAAVFDALFGLGRMQGPVDQPDLENIEAYGCDNVVHEHDDGRLTDGPPVADTDEELIETLQFLASHTGRSFSPTDPHLNLRLPGGARLAACAWVTPRPLVVIRRHRLREISIDELVDRGMLSAALASFLVAAVRAGHSVVISGPPGAGKTTLLRALCACLDFEEHIGTFETEYELHLHEFPARHRRVSPFEARTGSGERRPDGTRAGEVTLDEHLYHAWRHNLSRLIVGELRGKEITALFQAMQGSGGSMSTLHARSARSAIGRMVTLATDGRSSGTESSALHLVGQNIQLIVQITLDTRMVDGVRRRSRYVSEVLALEPAGDGRPTTTDVYRPGPDGRAVAGTLPQWLTGLARDGFDDTEFRRAS